MLLLLRCAVEYYYSAVVPSVLCCAVYPGAVLVETTFTTVWALQHDAAAVVVCLSTTALL